MGWVRTEMGTHSVGDTSGWGRTEMGTLTDGTYRDRDALRWGPIGMGRIEKGTLTDGDILFLYRDGTH